MDFGSINPAVLIASLMMASVPILLASLGELVVEKAGVLNLGVEGMMIMGTVLLYGLARHGLHFLHLFVPSGVPALLLPFIVMIEIISFLSRPISLSVRLFANILAGHITLAVFGGFVVLLLASNGWSFLAPVPLHWLRLALRRYNQASLLAQALAATHAHWGRIDFLINSAGWAGPTMPLDEFTLEVWNRVLNVNLNGVFLLFVKGY